MGEMKYLKKRGGRFSFYLRVPARFRKIVSEEFVIKALKTDSLTEAQKLAYIMRDEFLRTWEAKLAASSSSTDPEAFDKALALAKSQGIEIKRPNEIIESKIDDLLERINAVSSLNPSPTNPLVDIALLGVELPKTKLTAMAESLDTIRGSDVLFKNDRQSKNWKNRYTRAAAKFIAAGNADKFIDEINEQDAHKMKKYLVECIHSTKPETKITTDYANKHFGYMRKIIEAYYWSNDVLVYTNPFAGLNIRERPVHELKKNEAGKPEFSPLWISENIINHGGKLDTLNEEARDILIICAETGCRQAEIFDIGERSIFLDHEIPHLIIQMETEVGSKREIKTTASNRKVPLVGAALEAMKRHPKGFPKYRGTANFTNTVQKFFRTNELFPSPEHSLGGLRHSYESRLRRAGVDIETRGYLMGHSIKKIRGREVYGDVEGLKIKALYAELIAIETPKFAPRMRHIILDEINDILRNEGFVV